MSLGMKIIQFEYTKKISPYISRIKKIGKSVHLSIKDSVEGAPPSMRLFAKKFLLGSIGLFALIGGIKFYNNKTEQIRRANEIAAGPLVRVAKVTQSSGVHETVVLGETRPYQSVTLYAKVSGYLKSVTVDKGDHVKEGQSLAVIESPETDQAYAAAKANAKNKHDIAFRIKALFKDQLVSQQEADQAEADNQVSAAQYRSQEVLKGYEILRAPFEGTVTARFADPGALVQNAMNSQSSALPLVTVSQLKMLRVDIFLDQRDAPFIDKNDSAEITLTERPGFKIQGIVNRKSDQLDPRTKMMLIEIDIPNEDEKLVAGSFVQVALKIKSPPYLEAPVEAMILKKNKPYITVITPENQLTYRSIVLVGNTGRTLWISSGVEKGETLALSVGDSIPEGGKVRSIIEETTSAVRVPAGKDKEARGNEK